MWFLHLLKTFSLRFTKFSEKNKTLMELLELFFVLQNIFFSHEKITLYYTWKRKCSPGKTFLLGLVSQKELFYPAKNNFPLIVFYMFSQMAKIKISNLFYYQKFEKKSCLEIIFFHCFTRVWTFSLIQTWKINPPEKNFSYRFHRFSQTKKMELFFPNK